MKKLFLFLLSFTVIVANAQYKRSQMTRQYTPYSQVGSEFRTVLYPPLDTMINADIGAIAYLPADSSYYVKRVAKWVRIAGDSTLKDIHVYLVAGQSNAQGYNTDGSNKVTTEPGTVLQYYQGVIKQGNDPVGNANVSSAWPAWGRKYYSLTGRKVCFVPSAFSGTSQTAAANTGQGTWDTTGTLFDTSVARMKAAIVALRAAGYNPIVVGVLWSQGENDAIGINGALTTQADYLASLRKMITKYRDTFSKNFAFYIHQTATQTSASDVGYAQIRAAQVLAVNPDSLINIVFTNALDYPARGKFSDVYHYTQAGYNEMGEVSAANVVGANYEWQRQAGNIYTRFGNVGIGIGIPTVPLHVVGATSSTQVAAFTGRVGINRTTPLYGLDVGDSMRIRTLVISNLGFGGGTSLFTSTFLTVQNGQDIFINQGSASGGIPEFRLALNNSAVNQSYSGVYSFFNWKASAGPAVRQTGVITTTGFGAASGGATIGSLLLVPGTNFANDRSLAQYGDDSVEIRIRAAGIGEAYLNGKTTIAGRLKLKTVSSAAGTDSVAMWSPADSTFKVRALSSFSTSGTGSKSVVPQYRVAYGIQGDTVGHTANMRYIDSLKTLSAPYVNAFYNVTAGSNIQTAKPTKYDVLFGNSITAKTIAQKYLAYSSRLCNMANTLEINYGIGGTRMVSLSTGDSAMEEREYVIPTYNSSVHNNLYFAYGTNDWRTGSVDSAVFRTKYNHAIDAAVTKGWPLANIVVVSPGYSISSNTGLQHRNKEFVDIALDLGRKKSVKVVDVYTTMISHGGAMGLQPDSVHLNEYGNELWASAIGDTLQLQTGIVRSMSYLSARQLDLRQYLNHPPISIKDSGQTTAYFEVRGWHGVGSFDASFSIGLDAMDSITTGTNNYGIGQEALRGLTTGIGNNAHGFNTLNKNKTGNYNTFGGHNAGSKITGSNNTGWGAFAIQNATSVSGLTGIGYGALQANTTGINNTAVGASALIASTTANNSTAIGTNAAVAQTTGGDQTAIGTSALATNQAGTSNTAIGYLALTTLNGGVGSTAVGKNAGRFSASTASLNSYFGFGSGEQQTSASRNSFFGASSGKLANSGGNNVVVGYSAMDSTTTGTDNTILGYQALFNGQISMTRNIVIGSNAGLNWRLGNDNIILGGNYLVPVNTGWSKRLIISTDNDSLLIASDSTLGVGIGVLNPTAKLDVDGNVRIRTVATGTQSTDSTLVISGGIVKQVKAIILDFGTFTPTLTNTTNVSASTAYPGQWSRTGNTVTMSGEVDIDPTAGATLTVLTMTIPVASTLGNTYNLSGSANNDDVIGNSARVKSNGAGAAVISFIPNSLLNLRYSYIYQYTVN